jgi:hypothetical protein
MLQRVQGLLLRVSSTPARAVSMLPSFKAAGSKLPRMYSRAVATNQEMMTGLEGRPEPEPPTSEPWSEEARAWGW